MNVIINKFILAGDDFMSEMHLRQPRFTYKCFRTIYKKKTEYKNSKKQETLNISIKKKLGKACFRHDMAYGAYKDLLRRTVSDKVLFSKAFAIASNLKYDGYQCRLASIIYKIF